MNNRPCPICGAPKFNREPGEAPFVDRWRCGRAVVVGEHEHLHDLERPCGKAEDEVERLRVSVQRMRSPLTLTTPTGGPIAHDVLLHNAYVAGWQDGCDGVKWIHDETFMFMGKDAPADARDVYNRGWKTGQSLRTRSFNRAKLYKEAQKAGL